MRFTTTFLLILFCSIFGLSQTTVTFVVEDIPAHEGRQVGLRGNMPPLSWETSVPMQLVGEHYQTQLDFAADISEIEFKFVLFDKKDEANWETNSNRVLSLQENNQLTTVHQWDVEQLIDISTLPLLQPNQLLQDFELIQTMVLQAHPGTYRYNDEASIQAALDELKEKFQQPMTYGAAYLAMSKLTSQLKCGHTWVGLYNQNATINSIIHRQADKLPFAFTWVEDKMIVLHNASEAEALVQGAEVLSINGVAASRIQQQMLPYIPIDGTSLESRQAMMSVGGYDFEYYPFDVFYPLLFPAADQQLEVVFKPYGADQPQTVTVTPLTRAERAEKLVARYADFPKTVDDLWNFEITADKIGILTLNSFTLYGLDHLTVDYKDFFKTVFKQLKKQKVKHLIVDIRENYGGNDEIKHELFTYFNIDKKAKDVGMVGKTRYTSFPKALRPYIQTWGDDPWYYELEPDAVEEEHGYSVFKNAFESTELRKKKDAFKGELYLLTSPLNASLAFYLAGDFQQKKLGTIIGQTTAGNQRGINGGQILFLRLPHSEIEIDFPVMGGFTLGKRPDRGIEPAVAVQPTQAAIANGQDLVLEAAMELIKE
ncbi:MAG: S41 family peptidase [Bacteroidota bacterium]